LPLETRISPARRRTVSNRDTPSRWVMSNLGARETIPSFCLCQFFESRVNTTPMTTTSGITIALPAGGKPRFAERRAWLAIRDVSPLLNHRASIRSPGRPRAGRELLRQWAPHGGDDGKNHESTSGNGHPGRLLVLVRTLVKPGHCGPNGGVLNCVWRQPSAQRGAFSLEPGTLAFSLHTLPFQHEPRRSPYPTLNIGRKPAQEHPQADCQIRPRLYSRD
jgi:hypothetical protein